MLDVGGEGPDDAGQSHQDHAGQADIACPLENKQRDQQGEKSSRSTGGFFVEFPLLFHRYLHELMLIYAHNP